MVFTDVESEWSHEKYAAKNGKLQENLSLSCVLSNQIFG